MNTAAYYAQIAENIMDKVPGTPLPGATLVVASAQVFATLALAASHVESAS